MFFQALIFVNIYKKSQLRISVLISKLGVQKRSFVQYPEIKIVLLKILIQVNYLTLSARGYIVHPCRFLDLCILTGRALKLILYDFSSNFILNM